MTTISLSRNHSKTTLTPQEIFEISQEINKKYSPVTSANSFSASPKIALTSKQLLDISEDITRRFKPKLNTSFPKLVLLPIDPTHLFASWTLGEPDISSALKSKTMEHGLVLRVYPKPEKAVNEKVVGTWFDIAINPEQTRQKVTIPKEQNANSYAAVVGKLDQENRLAIIATSTVADTPRIGDISYYYDAPQTINPHPHSFSSIQENLPDSRYNGSSRSINKASP